MTPELSAHLQVLFPIAAVGVILPWLGHTRPGILFGVTVPVDFPTTPEARRSLRNYRLSVAALCLAVLTAAASILWLMPANGAAVTLTPIAAVLTELLGNLLLWRHQAARIKPHAITVPIERHADLNPASITGPIVSTASALLPLAATALWLRLHWSDIPTRWAQHWNAAGQADGWATRTPLGVYAALLNGALFVLILCAMLLFMAHASGPQTNQRRRALVPMAALAWLITGMFCLIGLTPLVHVTTAQFLTIMATYLVLIVAISIWLMYRGGLILSSPSTEPYDSTPDSGWHAGIFYFNKSDAAVIVPKRFGLGWTLNFARPTAWFYIGGLVAFLSLITVVSRWIK
jgi:uncharacterized membrane protein